ncbi:MAG TPA: HipA family kinase [Prolixibacteraceae bacterium]|nr:HipA family kinase [Prolixibacteraceae bacterium]
MQTLSGIQTANLQYDTLEKPVLILCNDMQEYVCKHALGADAMNLFCEYVADSFLRLWKLPVPDFAFVKINYDHVKQFGIPQRLTEKTWFGSKYSQFYQELHLFTDTPDVSKQKGYLDNRDNLLKIALFDIWMANEDRRYDHLNLMIDVSRNYDFVPIDHGAVFNTRTMNYPLTLLTEDECLTSIPLMQLLFPKMAVSKEYILKLKEYFYICTSECKQNFDEILSTLPLDWNIDLTVATHKVNSELFTSEWEEQVIKTFLEYIRSPF